jgi:hypothetical protein
VSHSSWGERSFLTWKTSMLWWVRGRTFSVFSGTRIVVVNFQTSTKNPIYFCTHKKYVIDVYKYVVYKYMAYKHTSMSLVTQQFIAHGSWK